ncbi:MAG: hypothetical protein MSA38_07680 [Bacteroidales bacterium]|nr:hypothetical protein [Bacteroidales bacterium]
MFLTNKPTDESQQVNRTANVATAEYSAETRIKEQASAARDWQNQQKDACGIPG